MADRSGIEWTEVTWNPTTGCDKTSPGCDNCYALTLAKRLRAMGQAKYQNDGDPRTSGPGFALTVHEDTLAAPHRWKSPRVIFVNSMSDLFHPDVSLDFIKRVFTVMAETPQHTYQVLTKRSKRLAAVGRRAGLAVECLDGRERRVRPLRLPPRSPPIGRRGSPLRQREPLLGPLPNLDLTSIDWLIAGGESGPNARPMDEDWVRDIRDQCGEAGVAFFFKQWGGRTPKAGGRVLDGAVYDEMPVSLAAS